MSSRNTTRLLKPTSSTQSMSSALSQQPAPLASAVFSGAVEEDLESQARASLSLFGFGSQDSVKWSPVSASAAATAAAAAIVDNTGTGSAIMVRVMERVCPIGTNKFLWKTMNLLAYGGEGSEDLMNSSADAATLTYSNGINGSGAKDSEKLNWDPTSSAAGIGNLFTSKVLQQYLVKCVALLPSSIEEVVDLLIRSDRDDMEQPVQHLVGVRTSSSAFIYRRRKKRQRRSHNGACHGSGERGTGSQRMAVQSLPQDCDSESSYSDSDLENEEDVQPFSGFSRESSTRRARSTRGDSLDSDRTGGHATPTRAAKSEPYLSESYMKDYRSAMASSGYQGNLSIKWVIAEKSSRMFASRTTYCLLDYECILVNDWDEDADQTPMYVRTMQSCYSPQCQSWLEEVGSKPTDLQPAGFMVRQARDHEGYVEIQLVASILEKAQLPMASRRAKLRALCAKIARLEEVLTSRRLSQSLLVNAPHWVHNRERLGCRICDARFGISRRRHHCRLCGEICCSDCCPKMDVALPDVGSTSVRVCIGCVQKRRKSCESAASSSIASTRVSFLSPKKEATSISPPIPSHPALRSASSSSSDYYSSSSSILSSATSSFTSASSLGERKPSLASSISRR